LLVADCAEEFAFKLRGSACEAKKRVADVWANVARKKSAGEKIRIPGTCPLVLKGLPVEMGPASGLFRDDALSVRTARQTM